MRFRKNKKGFTLVELIVVIAILAILAAVATVSITGIVNRSRENALRSDLGKYKEAYDVWMTDGGDGTSASFKTYINPSTGTYKITGSDSATYGTGTTWSATERRVSLTGTGVSGYVNLVNGTVTIN